MGFQLTFGSLLAGELLIGEIEDRAVVDGEREASAFLAEGDVMRAALDDNGPGAGEDGGFASEGTGEEGHLLHLQSALARGGDAGVFVDLTTAGDSVAGVGDSE